MTAALTTPDSTRTAPGASRTAVPLVRAGSLVGTRIALWVTLQLAVAASVVAGGIATADGPFNAAAGWWMVYGILVELGTLGVLVWIIRRAGISYRSLLGGPTAPWQVAIGAVAVLVASAPAIFFSSELTLAMYDTGTPPMLALVDVPPAASVLSIAVWPLLTELVEPVAYFGVLLPALERRLGGAWLAAPAMVAIWAVEHAFFPILVAGGGVDLTFAAYRIVSVLPFLATWAALYYAFGRRLLPIMAGRLVLNGGTAIAVGLGLA